MVQQADFFDRLMGILSQNGISRLEFCNLFGLSNTTLTHWKNGLHYPSIDLCLKISTKFHTSLDYLLTGETKNIDSTIAEDVLPVALKLSTMPLEARESILWSINGAISYYDQKVAKKSDS